MADAPNRYDDPYYTQLASAMERKLDLPIGLLTSIVTKGEKSNADQVSDAGARTVFQITPQTRRLILDRDGIDAYLSPENAAEAAGLVAKDGVNWAKARTSDPAAVARMAAGYYHAGGDTANWGPKTNAYMARVTVGMQGAKQSALDNDFASFMAANPAVPPADQRPQPAPARAARANDPLMQDFGAWKAQQDLKAQFPNRDYNNVPDVVTPGVPTRGIIRTDEQGRRYYDNTPVAQPTLGDQIVGAGEAALAGVTGATTGYTGAIGATIGNMAAQVHSALTGDGVSPNDPRVLAVTGGQASRDGDPDLLQAQNEAGAGLTYAPRTDAGQAQTQALGEALAPLAGLAPTEAAALHSGATPIVQATRAAARATPAAVADVVGAVKARAGAVVDAAGAAVDRVRGKTPEATPTPGSMGSAGAAGTDVALQRQATADSLPVPIKLTKGEATRDFAQQQFEQETAKNPELGAPLREDAANKNKLIAQNFDAMIDRTGAERASDLEAGHFIVDDVLKGAARQSEQQTRALYQRADNAGETLAPVDIAPVLDYLNSQPSGLPSTALPDAAKAYAVKLGLATVGEDGSLRPASVVNLRDTESWRKEINKATGADPTDIRQATVVKDILDGQTEGAGGELYAQARKARQRHAQLFENNSIVADLMDTKPGTSDRTVALEKVVDRIITTGSREDLSMLRRTLHVSDQHAGITPGTTGPGAQAWREIQAATLRRIARDAGAEGKSATRDVHGNPIISPAGLHKSVENLDRGGRLDFILGKQWAQTVRDIDDISANIKTSPPGTVNHSNTASAFAALVDVMASATTGLPAPIASVARIVWKHRADNAVRARVRAALHGTQLNPPPGSSLQSGAMPP